MTPHTDIDHIADELRALMKTHNGTPRLLADMVTREFPNAAELIYQPHVDDLEKKVEWLYNAMERFTASVGIQAKMLNASVAALQREFDEEEGV